MSTTPPDYNEPWKVEKESTIWISTTTPEDGGDIACVEPDYGASTAYWPQRAERIVACVNALAGIPDPKAAIQAARDALEQIDQHLRKTHGAIEKFQDKSWRDQNPLKCEINFKTVRLLLKAINLLTPAPWTYKKSVAWPDCGSVPPVTTDDMGLIEETNAQFIASA